MSWKCFLVIFVVDPPFLANFLYTDGAGLTGAFLLTFALLCLADALPTSPLLEDIDSDFPWISGCPSQDHLPVLCNRPTGAMCHRSLCLFINNTTVVHTWLAPHCQTTPEPEPDFRGQWLGRGGQLDWSTRSPDPNPLDLAVGRLKTLVLVRRRNCTEHLLWRVWKHHPRVNRNGCWDTCRLTTHTPKACNHF
jgi:hypothetical protein